MADKPILFSGPMVRALLAGTKTQTRRALKKPNWADAGSDFEIEADGPYIVAAATGCTAKVPLRIAVGDRLWVRETWCDVNLYGAPGIAYRANSDVRDLMEEPSFLSEDGAFDYDAARLKFGKKGLDWAVWAGDLLSGVEGNWRTPLHMPRWASRLTLTVTGVRVERLQDISEADAVAEGMERLRDMADPSKRSIPEFGIPDACAGVTARDAYASLWNAINGPGAWAANPFVAAYTFTVQRGNIDEVHHG